MLRHSCRVLSRECRQYATTAVLTQQVPMLEDASITTFRTALYAGSPVLLPRKSLSTLPAIRKWFSKDTIDASYLARFGANIVPLEFSNGKTFARVHQPLSYFLECLAIANSRHEQPNRYFSSYVPGARAIKRVKAENDFFNKAVAPKTQIYLAQAPIADLPRALRNDLPTPSIVQEAGKGDIYDSSIWIGLCPTYTPLHRDPNENLFVQMAGRKEVRLFRPDIGRAIFSKVQEEIGGDASQAFRGEEMMQGAERVALDREVWNDVQYPGYHVELAAGDALFIPKGWWHSIKSVGTGINGSVNWWFR